MEKKSISAGWPVTLAEAVNRLMAGLTKADKKRIAAMAKADLIKLHMTFGMKIRNDFGLWQGNDALINACGLCEPDDMSTIIIEALWKAVKKARP